MKAMVIPRYGGPEVFELADVPAPRLRPGEVLVRVRGSSVNPVDCGIRAGALSSFLHLHLPTVLGVDIAGEVAAAGAGATRFAVGDRVYAYTGIQRGGGYGELAAIPESFLAPVPANLSWAEAGTVPGVGATGYEAFTVHVPLRPGMRVLINGAAGGVGTYAIQIARAMGADVSGTCSTPKVPLVRELGAGRAIDYTKGDPFDPVLGRYHVILNAVRGAPLARMRDLLDPGGVLVTVTGESERGQDDHGSSRRTVSFIVQTSGELLAGLGQMIEQGRVRPVVERVYAWNELAAAHHRCETGRVAGKLAIVPA
jgi:NADPH:quinone reductase-like Zn-dependent oxidoreductase